ncbi:hypothetical protein [Calycomorphotria hydatis]|uniref:Uncharacterized protein n=1 Tax=Calycomorphotria hydatis TaxID=2528027 RepID=A0A517T4T0_9PLAN|nr:hypothetical protein [Calycomorphotria hydatis]QDT63392.1 hypothetical protein V22_06130 [Calycomorphotria hydatis]
MFKQALVVGALALGVGMIGGGEAESVVPGASQAEAGHGYYGNYGPRFGYNYGYVAPRVYRYPGYGYYGRPYVRSYAPYYGGYGYRGGFYGARPYYGGYGYRGGGGFYYGSPGFSIGLRF